MGYLDQALAKGTGAAPNRFYSFLVAIFGLATLALGILWAMEKPPAPPTEAQAEILRMFPDAKPAPSNGLGEVFGTMAAITAVLLLSWWTVRKRQGIRRPAPARAGKRPGRRDGKGPVG